MAEITCYLLDITYKVLAGKPVIYLYGRTLDGQQVCLVDKLFQPYFYVVAQDLKEVSRNLKDFKVEKNNVTYQVVAVKEVQKNYLGKETRALQVFVNIPQGVPIISSEVRHIEGVSHVHEYDILFIRRYLLDKNITPLTLLRAEATPLKERSKVPIFEISNIENIKEDTLLKPRILAIDIETYNPEGRHVLPETHPIIMLAAYGDNFQRVITWKEFDTDKDITFVNSEDKLIKSFIDLIEEYKPDIIAGYYSDGFDLPYIITRAKKYGISLNIGLDYSALRINRGNKPSVQTVGIVHLDILSFIRRVIGRSMETNVYSLDAVAQELLHEPKHEVDMEKLAERWDKNQDLEEYAVYNLKDAELTYRLSLKIFPNILELVKIVSLPLFDVPRMGFSQLVEWYIMKQAVVYNELFLNKPSYHQMQYRLDQRAQGASVFEPKPGLYKDIVVFDFRSLYPSIIVSHNISLDILNCACCRGTELVPLEGKKYWYCKKNKGFVSVIIEDLISRRARIKEIIKKEEQPDALLLARSEALKLLSNAFYGYLGFNPARWYCAECVASTTAYGRYYINKVIKKAREDGFEVLYSDTDSVFLLLEEKSEQDALQFMEGINLDLPGLMELEFEGFYPAGLFVATKTSETGAKKRYALLDTKGHIKIKGFESVRRNVSGIAKKMQEEVLRIILRENDAEKAQQYVQKTIDDLRSHKLPVEDMIIGTQLTKEIEQYENIGPHVAAAKRMKEQGRDVFPGSIVQFVIIKGKGKIRDKVRLPEEVNQEDYDPEYYINNQILPAVERILAVLGFSKEDFAQDKVQSTLGSFIK